MIKNCKATANQNLPNLASAGPFFAFFAPWRHNLTSDDEKTQYGKKNAKLWISTAEDSKKTFSDNQINLFVLGYLRALRSNGNNDPHGFPGIFQADVMMRRGTVALKIGTVRGQKITDIWSEWETTKWPIQIPKNTLTNEVWTDSVLRISNVDTSLNLHELN